MRKEELYPIANVALAIRERRRTAHEIGRAMKD